MFNTLHVCTLLQIVTDVHLFLEKKTQRHVENVIMMFNHTGFSDNAYLLFENASTGTGCYFYNALFLW